MKLYQFGDCTLKVPDDCDLGSLKLCDFIAVSRLDHYNRKLADTSIRVAGIAKAGVVSTRTALVGVKDKAVSLKNRTKAATTAFLAKSDSDESAS